MHRVKTVAVGPLMTNCYLIGNPETDELLIFDPGADAQAIKDAVRDMGMKRLLSRVLRSRRSFLRTGTLIMSEPFGI